MQSPGCASSGMDFFKDPTRAAICSVSGDVWIVSGLDESLGKLEWKRFATGLFQTMGLRIVKGHDLCHLSRWTLSSSRFERGR